MPRWRVPSWFEKSYRFDHRCRPSVTLNQPSNARSQLRLSAGNGSIAWWMQSRSAKQEAGRPMGMLDRREGVCPEEGRGNAAWSTIQPRAAAQAWPANDENRDLSRTLSRGRECAGLITATALHFNSANTLLASSTNFALALRATAWRSACLLSFFSLS